MGPGYVRSPHSTATPKSTHAAPLQRQNWTHMIGPLWAQNIWVIGWNMSHFTHYSLSSLSYGLMNSVKKATFSSHMIHTIYIQTYLKSSRLVIS